MLHRHTPKNIALKLPYPKIEKTVPQFLTPDERIQPLNLPFQ